MANYTTKRKYTKKATTPKKTVTKKLVAPEPIKEPSLLEKAVSWVKSLIK